MIGVGSPIGVSNMPIPNLSLRFLNLLLISLSLSFPATAEVSSDPSIPPGIVIETLGGGSVLTSAGLQPGDNVYGWESEGQLFNAIMVPSDWFWLEMEQAPRGSLKLLVRREGREQSYVVTEGLWEANIQPLLPAYLLDLYRNAREAEETGDRSRSLNHWVDLRALAQEQSDDELLVWVDLRIAQFYRETSEWESSTERLQQAIQDSQSPLPRLIAIHALATLQEERGQYEEAESSLRQAFELSQAHWPGALIVARSHTRLCSIAWKRSDLQGAEKHCQEALKIQQEIAPESLETAATLRLLGAQAWYLGEIEVARQLAERSVAIRKRLAPGSLEMASSLDLLAVTYDNEGPDHAEHLHRQALAIREKLAPGGLDVAASLNNLGVIYRRHGDLETAIEYYSRALSIQEKLAPVSADITDSLSNMAVVLRLQGKHEGALDYYGRTLEIQRKVAPDSPRMATTLNNIGNVYVQKKEFDIAESYYLHALKIQERHAPSSFHIAMTLEGLGGLYILKGNISDAIPYMQRALRIKETVSPFSLETAGALNNSGNLLYRLGKLDEARSYFSRCTEIFQILAPGSQGDTLCLFALATIDRRQGRSADAERYFKAALTSFERQLDMAGVIAEAKAKKRASNRAVYVDYLDFLVEQRRPEEAFTLSERYRAQMFLNLLAERDLAIDSEIPVALREQQEKLRAEYERAQSALIHAARARGAEPPSDLVQKTKKLWDEFSEAKEAIRKVDSRAAALRYAISLDAQAIRQRLDPGLCLLSYILGDRSILLFMSRENSPKAFILDIERDELGRKVEMLRRLLASSRLTENSARRQATLSLASELYTLLLAPVEEQISQCKRLLILPDGPLHTLPWGALLHEVHEAAAAPNRRRQFLSERIPYEIALSATVFSELRSYPRSSTPTSGLRAFGDPQFHGITGRSSIGIPEQEIRTALQRGFDFSPLPGSRLEVSRIREFFGDEARVYLGEEATEENAKAVTRQVRFIHFATHTFIDEELPLNSAVALTIPEELGDDRENGLLQAWEVFDQIRLDADLVVLSACETGLGKDLGGEGLIGLTRAFQYAGARSVLASLWKISDRTTAELMVRFYKHLKAGKTKDEALRSAQIELIRGPIEITNEKGEVEKIDASAPYYWAAFQLYGDWQ